jgi:dTDP-glucose 4,6-dehydratase
VFVRGDIANAELVEHLCSQHGVTAVLNLAAESHVDRSILGPSVFVETNVSGTQVLLEAARRARVRRFIQVSTDEVYGSLGADGRFSEGSPIQPSSPYSASKAAADLLALAYHRTFGLDVVVTRCSNNYGSHQFPEKLIPLMVANALEGKKLPVYGDGLQVRDWIHVEDHCAALVAAVESGKPGEVYNVGGDNEWPNLMIVRELLRILGKPESLVEHVKDRPGHDRRYAIDPRKARAELRWAPRIAFAEGLRRTVDWYVANRAWWERVRSGEYRAYYEKNYGARG